ncbi:MAG: putative Ig domain-containing protein, partial [Verrucomicrobiae bacterium]|nr:putative Ig domain-containing protein [Verrucomicrobiae bacterium]
GLLASALAQTSQTRYDASGNPAARAAAAIALPEITGQPVSQIVEPGHAATFSVVLADPRGATFQWKFNGTDLRGQTGDSLRVPAAAANEGTYTVAITNDSGSVTSAEAQLFIDSDGDRLPDSWETAHFGDLSKTALADTDGDGVTNLDEYLQGTHPASPASFRARLTLATTGSGTVAVSPEGADYAAGSTVTLTPTPTPPWVFDHWSGDLASTTNPAPLTLTSNKSVTAHFVYPAPPPGLVAWWRGETDASDTIGGHHGAFYAGTTSVPPAIAAGKAGSALSFDGATHIRVPASEDFRLYQFSMEAWVYPTVKSAEEQVLFALGSNTSADNVWRLVLVNGLPWLYSNSGVSVGYPMDNALNNPVPLNQWTHLAFTYDGANFYLYINGGGIPGFDTPIKGSGYARKLAYDVALAPLTIGSDWDNGASTKPFHGLIDELSLYQRALTQAEIKTILARGSEGKSADQPYFTTLSPLPEAATGDAYAARLATVNGPAPITVSLAEGSRLPSGLTLAPDGALTGTPTTIGDFAFTVQAQDAAARLNLQSYSLRVVHRALPAPGLIAWWPGEPDASGLGKDVVGGHDATFYQNTFSGTLPIAATHTSAGKVGGAFDFDAPRFATVPEASVLQPAQLTGEVWVYPMSSVGGSEALLARGFSSSSTSSWWLGLNASGSEINPRIRLRHQKGTAEILASGTLPVQQWSHLAFTFDGARLALYVNGVLAGAAEGLGALVYDAPAPDPLTLGAAQYSATDSSYLDFFTGRLDEAALYNRALSALEIRQIYDAGAAGKGLPLSRSVDLGPVATGRPFFSRFTWPDGVPTVAWEQVSGVLPPGLTLASDGTLSGVASARGAYSFNIRGTDADGAAREYITSISILKAAAVPPGLISWYRAENDALDALGANQGAFTGAPGFAPGKVGTAFSFTDTSHVEIPDSESLHPESFTIETWYFADALSASGSLHNTLIYKRFGAEDWTYSWKLECSGAELTGSIVVGNVGFSVSGGTVDLARWHHVALTCDAAAETLSLYVDGVKRSSSGTTGAPGYDAHPVLISGDTAITSAD